MMDIKAAMQMLEKSQGDVVNNIYIPSARKELPFKPLTTGQQKSISKFSFDNGNEEDTIDEDFVKLALFDALRLDESISSSILTEVDMLAFYAGLRLSNIIAPLRLHVECSNLTCEKDFAVDVNIEDIIKKCKTYKSKTVTFEKEVNKIEYSFVLGEPSFKNLVEFEQYVQILTEEDVIPNLDDFRALTTPLLYIREAMIGGNTITNFFETDFLSKLKFYEQLKGDITITSSSEDAKDCLLSQTLEHFSVNDEINKLFNNIKCPHCQNEMESVLSYDNFFII